MTSHTWLPKLPEAFCLCGCAECALESAQGAALSATVRPQSPSQDTPVSRGLLTAACDQEHTELGLNS